MSRFSVSSGSGNLRATSDDGQRLHLTIFDPDKPGAPLYEWEGTVLLEDLRQIVEYFRDPPTASRAESVIAELEENPKLARRLAGILAKLAQQSYLRNGTGGYRY